MSASMLWWTSYLICRSVPFFLEPRWHWDRCDWRGCGSAVKQVYRIADLAHPTDRAAAKLREAPTLTRDFKPVQSHPSSKSLKMRLRL